MNDSDEGLGAHPHDPQESPAGVFARRLRSLIEALYPDERTRPGYARLAQEIRERTGGSISGTYLWELTTARKRNVTIEQLGILAQFFGVPPEYFLNDEVAERVGAQLALVTALRDAKVRSLALRADGLSPATLDALLIMVNEARRVEKLSPVAPGDPNSPSTEPDV
jgi:transcriptional regulator with XRE-family HTH domain